MSSSPVDAAFTRSLPKIELHAHLTGSITPQTLHEIWQLQSKPTLQDPLVAMSSSKSWDISTFFPLFSSYIYALICDRESVAYSTNAVLKDFMQDGVMYLELRTTPRESPGMSKREYIETVLDCMDSFAGKETMSTFLILSIDRRNTPEQAMEVIKLAIKYRERHVVGVDLCGDPSKGDVSIFAPAFAKAKQAGLKITLHFAEVPASSSRYELETLMTFGPDRLGHVIHVPEDIRMEILRRKIGVELCVSCNVQAKMTTGGVGGHHFGWWRERGGSIVLCVSHAYLILRRFWIDAHKLYDEDGRRGRFQKHAEP